MAEDRTELIPLRRWLCLAGVAALLGLQVAAAQEALVSAEDRAGGRLEIHEISGTPSHTVAVWLPPGYAESGQRYPVAYLLHGAGGAFGNFTESANAPGSVARLVAEGRIEPMILVMPNRGNADLSPGFWDFVTTDLVAWVGQTFRTVPERGRRAIAGHSWGAVDALKIALFRPDLFRYAGTLDLANPGPLSLEREVHEPLMLHRQFLFPLSLWMQRGRQSISEGYSPRPLLDLLDALHLPHVYVETEDDHQLSRDNNTDDFLVFFSDGMRANPVEPASSGRVTEQFVVEAGSGSSMDIEIDLRGASDYAGASLRLDLSALGMEPAVLEQGGSGRYTYALRLPDAVRNGVYILSVCRVGGAREPEHVYGIRVSVLPGEDAVLFGEALAPGWQLEPNSRLTAAPGVADGRAVLALVGTGAWTLKWSTLDPLPLFGYETLSFEFNAGTASVTAGSRPDLRLTIPGQRIDLLTQVDLTSSEWQRVSLPLAAPEGDQPLELKALTFTGNLQGTFHLRDARLVRQMPPASTAVAEAESSGRPRAFALRPNYPNPFNSATTLRFDLPQAAVVELAVYNLAGQQVATLVQGDREPGGYTVTWDGRDTEGRPLASGVYLCQLRAAGQVGGQVDIRKLLLLR
ncbi:MAG: alpha/beta hydrolase-fold protein [Candidatus Latescibacterota bacterium]